MANFGIPDRKSGYDKFKSHPILVEAGSKTAYGVLEEVNLQEGYLSLRPSLVTSPTQSRAILQQELPTIIYLPVEVIRPLENGMLEEAVKSFNERVEQRKKEEAAQGSKN